MNNTTNLYRKRFIPSEDNLLKDDVILFESNEYIVTKWKVPKERDDFNNGYSILDLKNHIKFSKFMKDDELVYYYTDIVDYECKNGLCRSVDLLVDVIVMPCGAVKVLDLDELEDACKDGLITIDDVFRALKYTDEFLKLAYNCELQKYYDLFEKYEKK